MIQILKQAPITFNGVDGWEVLIKDDELGFRGVDGCNKCMYDYVEITRMENIPCPEVMRCGYDDRTYFEFKTEPDKHEDRNLCR